MKKTVFLLLLLVSCFSSFSQKMLMSWSQRNIENYTEEMYNDAQKLTTSELLVKNLNDKYWSEVFLTLNASINNFSKDTGYLIGLANQISNNSETKLLGTSRLIIWDRIITGDILFEGKGLIFENDLFKVGGRANEILQELTKKNFGYVTINATDKELDELKNRWLNFLSNKPQEEYIPFEYKNAKFEEVASLTAVQALVISVQPNPDKDQLTKKCLKQIYHLDEMPKDKDSQAKFCDPDTYSLMYLGMLFGDEKMDKKKDAEYWQKFWNKNHNNLVWNAKSGSYEIKRIMP